MPKPAQTSLRPVAWIAIAVTAVAAFEGFSPKKYYDSVGVATICYGATAADGVDLSRTYNKAECEAMLGNDLPKYDGQIRPCLKPEVYAALPPYRHAALVSLAYNIGGAGVCHSSVVRDLNAGLVQKACDDFLAYNHAGGHVLAGLTTRRQAERRLCLKNDSVITPPKPVVAPVPIPPPQPPSLWQRFTHWMLSWL